MAFRIRWLGTACFEIQLPNLKTVIIDPYVDDSVNAPISSGQFEGCDYIFITHGHYDHILDVGKLTARFQSRVFCNDEAAHSLITHQRVPEELIRHCSPGDVIREEGLVVEVVPGVHVNFEAEYKRLTGRNLVEGGTDFDSIIKKALKEMLGTDRIPEQFKEWMGKYPQGEVLNFIFEPTDGQRIYMAGTYPDPSIIEVARRSRAYITLLQVLAGKTLDGLEEKVAKIAVASGCQIVVPQHHDPLIKGAQKADLSKLRKILAEESNIAFQEFVPGEWYKFR